MGEYGVLYAAGRDRIIGLVADLDPGAAATPVPTCPQWSVKDTLAHVTGICADIIAGNIAGAPGDAWTAAQVVARRDQTVAEIVAEWQETGPQIDGMIDAFGATGAQLLFDLTTHEHDVRLALASPGARDAPVLPVAIEFAVTGGFAVTLKTNGVGPVEIRSGDRTWVVGGDGDPKATLTAPPFELLRALSGRRSASQIAAMDWSADPSPFLSSFEGGPFTFPPEDIAE